MNEIITIDGVKYKRIEEEKPVAKYKVGDWVKVIANKTQMEEKDNYIGQIYQITNVYDLGYYKRKVNDKFIYTYNIGEFYVVYEDEIELAEEPKKSVFDRQKINSPYYHITNSGTVSPMVEHGDKTDGRLFYSANYCSDEKLMEQRALREVLNRLLWRASVEAGELDNPWDGKCKHHEIYLNNKGEFMTYYDFLSKSNAIYFPTKESAQSAIDNIIKPFMADHPDFEW